MTTMMERLRKVRTELVESAPSTASVRDLPIGDIDPDPEQPRKDFQGIEDLAESIKVHGVLQPIGVVAAGDRWRMVWGERRWRAAQVAGLLTIPAKVLPAGAAIAELQILENVDRQDLSPLELGAAVQRLLDKASMAEVGRLLGKPKTWVVRHAAVAEMPPVLTRLLANGSALRAVHDLHVAAKTQPALLTACEGLETVTMVEANRLIQRGSAAVPSAGAVDAVPVLPPGPASEPKITLATTGAAPSAALPAGASSVKASPATPQPKDPNTAALEAQIEAVLGLRTRIAVGAKERGTLTVEFRDFDQLEELTRRLSRH